MKLLLLILSFAFVRPVLAEELVPLSLADELRPLVKSLTRPVRTYNYASRKDLGLPDTGAIAARDPRAFQYVQRQGAFYEANEQLTTAEGPVMPGGLYLAFDPVVTTSFGTASWGLTELTLPAGFRVLDFRAPVTPPLSLPGVRLVPPRAWHVSEEAERKLLALGCRQFEWSKLALDIQDPICRRVMLRTFRELDVDAFIYPYNETPLDGCALDHDGAMIVLKTDRLTASAVRLFVAERPAEANDDLLQSRRGITAELLQGRAMHARGSEFQPWPELESPPPAVDVRALMAAYSFGCGDHVEDRVTAQDPPALVTAIAYLQQGLANQTLHLSSELRVFGWASRRILGAADSGELPAKLPAALELLNGRGRPIFGRPDSPGISGFDLSTDPGEADGAFTDLRGILFDLRLPASFTILDLANGSDGAFEPALAARLKNAGCEAEDPAALWLHPTTTACRDVAVAYLRAAHVEALRIPADPQWSCENSAPPPSRLRLVSAERLSAGDLLSFGSDGTTVPELTEEWNWLVELLQTDRCARTPVFF